MTKSRILWRNSSGFSSFSQGFWAMQAGGLFLLTCVSFFPALFHAEELLFFSLLIVAILMKWIEGKDFNLQTPIDLPLLLLLGWILVTIPFSLNPEYSFMEWRKLLAQCLVFYWAVHVMHEITQRPQRENANWPFKKMDFIGGSIPIHHVLMGILIGTWLLSSFTLVDFFSRGGNWQDRQIRAIVPGSDYNWLSTYLILSIPLVLYCSTAFRGIWGKAFSMFTLILAGCAQIASYSRAGWLASMVQIFFWGLVMRRRFLILILICGIFIFSLVLVEMSKVGYHMDTLHTWTVDTRLQVWKLGIEQIIRHPFVGIGYGNHMFQPVLLDSPMMDIPMHLHNTPMMIGVGTGIPGLIFFFWVFIRLGQELFPSKNPKYLSNSDHLKLFFGIIVVGFFFRNLFDYMFAGSIAYLFWILMACGLEGSVKKTSRTGGNFFTAIGTRIFSIVPMTRHLD